MRTFTPSEIEYLNSQRLGRLATVNGRGQPHVVPVTFRYNPELGTLDISGLRNSSTKKWRDIAENDQIAFVVDDVLPPWKPRMVEVRGRAEQVATGGKRLNVQFEDSLIRVHPSHIVAFGIDEPPAPPK